MKFRKIIFGIILSLLFNVVIAKSEPKKVVLWHAYRGSEREGLEKVASMFNSANKDKIELELLAIPFDAFPDKVTASVPRGKGPDLFIFSQDRLGDWAVSNVIEPIEFWVTPEIKSQFFEQTITALTYENSLYGLPMAFKSTALYYNKNLIPKPPETTDEMIELAKKVTNLENKVYGLVYENANFYYHACWHQGFGGKIFDDKMKPILNSPEAIEGLEFARKLAKEAKIMPEEISNVLVTSLFNDGKAAMVISGPWFMAEIKEGLPFGVALLPIISQKNKRATPFMGSEGILMSKTSQNKMEAFEVMKYLTSAEAGKIMATLGKQTVANKEVYNYPEVAQNPIIQVFKEQLNYTIPMPNIPQMRIVWSPITTAMSKVISGNSLPKDALNEAQNKVIELINMSKSK